MKRFFMNEMSVVVMVAAVDLQGTSWVFLIVQPKKLGHQKKPKTFQFIKRQ